MGKEMPVILVNGVSNKKRIIGKMESRGGGEAQEVTDPKKGPALVSIRVARWFVFKPKIQNWVNFRGSCNGTGWYILRSFVIFGIVRGNLVFFPRFGILYPRKIWQPWFQYIVSTCCTELPANCFTRGTTARMRISLRGPTRQGESKK
jgi:hypothetical protein